MQKKGKSNSTDFKLLPFSFRKKTVREAPNNICKITVQDSVPIFAVHEKYNLVEPYTGLFVRSYTIGENNYQSETEECEKNMFIKYRSMLNSLGTNTEFAITIFNKDINIDDFKERALKKETGDNLDYLRRELNTITLDRIKEGRNGIEKKKYLTIGVHAENVKKAHEVFSRRLDRDIDNRFTKIKSSAKPIPIEEKLEMLHDIYNMDCQGEFLIRTKVTKENGTTQEITSFDFENMRSMGITINDMIAPPSMQVFADYMIIGKKYVRSMIVDNLPSSLVDDFFVKLTDVPFNILATANIQPIASKDANRIVHDNLLLAREEKNYQRLKLIHNNASEDMISPDIEEKVQKAEELRNEMHEEDEKLFKTTLTLVFWADSLDQLKEYTDTIVANCQGAVVDVSTMNDQQEALFNTTLPLCCNEIPNKLKRTLKSSSAATISLPFSNLELLDPGGINYSMHLISKNLIIYDRLKTANFNGFILGTPGSGKSFAAKIEMINVMLGSNSDCIVIDPEKEYIGFADLIGGEVIEIKPGGKWHINPMEISSGYEFHNSTDFDEEDVVESNPVLAKADFILKLMETLVKTPFGLNSIQETIIDECVQSLYAPFIDQNGNLKPIPPEKMPTLTDLQVAFAKRREPEARELAYSLKLYTGTGSLNTFGFRSNVNIHNRFVVFDIHDVGETLRPLAMLIILDFIQSKLFENRKRGKFTWFWIDEIYLLFQSEDTASFLNMLYKRSRKYGGVPTGITQNVEDLLESDTARKMLSNCNFVEILNQATSDRNKLRDLLQLSESQVDVVTTAPFGQGLIFTGTNCIPFYSTFPKNNSIYRVLTSNMREIAEYKEQERRRKMQEKKAAKKREIGA